MPARAFLRLEKNDGIDAFGAVALTGFATLPAFNQQVTISAPILLIVAPLFGELVRDLALIHLAGLLFQIVAVVSAGFIFWVWLLTVYPASGVASFSFLSPVIAVVFGWWLLGEEVGLSLIGSLVLVAAGILLINLAPRSRRTSGRPVRPRSAGVQSRREG